jgi:hypothetical protein
VSNRAKGLLISLLDRLFDGPKCPNCKHDVAIHYDEGHCYCLGAKYDHGVHVGWCDCTDTRKKEKARV